MSKTSRRNIRREIPPGSPPYFVILIVIRFSVYGLRRSRDACVRTPETALHFEQLPVYCDSRTAGFLAAFVPQKKHIVCSRDKIVCLSLIVCCTGVQKQALMSQLFYGVDGYKKSVWHGSTKSAETPRNFAGRTCWPSWSSSHLCRRH